jgi:hypothetical protein
VRDAWGGDDTGWGELDPLHAVQAQFGAEQAHSVAEDHGHDVQLQLIEQSELDHLPEQRAAAGDRHVLPVRSRAGLLDGAVDAGGKCR